MVVLRELAVAILREVPLSLGILHCVVLIFVMHCVGML
jgi:hypothetical protein